jgi:hypothetical protein
MQRERGKNEWDEKTKMAYGTHTLNILNLFSTDRFNSVGLFANWKKQIPMKRTEI